MTHPLHTRCILVGSILASAGCASEVDVASESSARGSTSALAQAGMTYSHLRPTAVNVFSDCDNGSVFHSGYPMLNTYYTGIDCKLARQWNTTAITGIPQGEGQMRSDTVGSSFDDVIAADGTAAGLILEIPPTSTSRDATNPNSKLIWFAAKDTTRPTHGLHAGTADADYLYPWSTLYAGGSNEVLVASFKSMVTEATRYGTVPLPMHATVSLTMRDTSKPSGEGIYYHQCKIFINGDHPTTINAVANDAGGTGQPMAISLLSDTAKFCNAVAGSPNVYRTTTWSTPEQYDIRFTWGHVLNAITMMNSTLGYAFSTNRDDYRLVAASLNVELGRRASPGYAGTGTIGGRYSDLALKTQTY